MFLFFISFSLSYDLSFLSSSVKKRINGKKMLYQCFQGGQFIPLKQLDNGICDCCDCSDEFMNTSVITANNCISNKLSKPQLEQLRDVYKNNIIARNQIKRGNEQRLNQLEVSRRELLTAIETRKRSLNKILEQISISKTNLREWVYSTNGLKMPTEEEMLARKDKFIKKESHIESKKKRYDEEEEEGFSYTKLEDTNFEEKQRVREVKWKQLVKEEYNQLLEMAIKKAQEKETSNHFLSKLKENPLPDTVITYQNLKRDKQKQRSELTQMFTQLNEIEELLKFTQQFDPVWLSAFKKLVHGPIEGSKGDLRITLFTEALIKASYPQPFSMGRFSYFNQTMRFVDGTLMKDDERGSLNTYLFCHHKLEFMYATRQAISRYTAWIGLPEACPETFSNAEFDKLVAIIEPFSHKIVIETSEL